MNELIEFIIDGIKRQQGWPRHNRRGICKWLQIAIHARFKEEHLRALTRHVDGLPEIDLAGYCFELTDEGDLERIKWLESLKQ